MPKDFIAQQSITIDAPASRVWDALTDPKLIRQYLFGAEASSDWQEGSPITYRGTWQGTAYEGKGVILRIVSEELLQIRYWSSYSGRPNEPENYQQVDYVLAPRGATTTVTITQNNNFTSAGQAQAKAKWHAVLVRLKRILEK